MTGDRLAGAGTSDGFERLVRDVDRVLSAWAAPDPAQEQLRTDFLAHARRGSRAGRRDGDPEHFTASCVVLSPDLRHTLLTLHRKAGMWLQLGGHLEPGDTSVREAARREALEESGIGALDGAGADLELSSAPVDLDRHELARSFGRCRAHLDIRYAAVVRAPVVPALETATAGPESHEVRWWPVEALPQDQPADLSRLVGAAVRTARRVAASVVDASPS